MTNCEKCGRALEIASNDGLQHDVCYQLSMTRTKNKLCYKCGDNPFLPGQGWMCTGCHNGGKFKNFPGPS